jgi:hypothetical protein
MSCNGLTERCAIELVSVNVYHTSYSRGELATYTMVNIHVYIYLGRVQDISAVCACMHAYVCV